MPPDLLFAISVMLATSTAIFFLDCRLLQKPSRWLTILIALLGTGGLVLHAIYLNENAHLVRLIPSANVIVWGNFSPIFTALLAALAWRKMRAPLWQRALACTALFGICIYQAYAHLLGHPPRLSPDRWTNGICRQSTTSTCSAAATATLLAQYGIHTTESEMANLCLTRTRGTTALGIYRGLKIKSQSHVQILQGSLDQLLAQHRPAVISIGLSHNDPAGVGLPIGNSHSVVLLNENPIGTLEIADPFAGLQTWKRDQLEAAWQHEAFVLNSVPTNEPIAP